MVVVLLAFVAGSAVAWVIAPRWHWVHDDELRELVAIRLVLCDGLRFNVAFTIAPSNASAASTVQRSRSTDDQDSCRPARRQDCARPADDQDPHRHIESRPRKSPSRKNSTRADSESATESATTKIPVPPPAPYGPGSAQCRPGWRRAAGWLVKGADGHQLYYIPGRSTYDAMRRPGLVHGRGVRGGGRLHPVAQQSRKCTASAGPGKPQQEPGSAQRTVVQ